MSELRADTITASAGTSPVTLTGQAADTFFGRWDASGTYVINSSLNISSITDSAAGASLITYATNFANTDYAAFMFAGNDGAARGWQQMDGNAVSAPNTYGTLTTSQLAGYTGNGATSLVDTKINNARAIGGLA